MTSYSRPVTYREKQLLGLATYSALSRLPPPHASHEFDFSEHLVTCHLHWMTCDVTNMLPVSHDGWTYLGCRHQAHLVAVHLCKAHPLLLKIILVAATAAVTAAVAAQQQRQQQCQHRRQQYESFIIIIIGSSSSSSV